MELIKASLMAVAGGGGGNLQTKTFTQNGTYSPDSGYDGFSRVTVDVDDYYDEWQAALTSPIRPCLKRYPKRSTRSQG